jgi:hypothetical protein
LSNRLEREYFLHSTFLISSDGFILFQQTKRLALLYPCFLLTDT